MKWWKEYTIKLPAFPAKDFLVKDSLVSSIVYAPCIPLHAPLAPYIPLHVYPTVCLTRRQRIEDLKKRIERLRGGYPPWEKDEGSG